MSHTYHGGPHTHLFSFSRFRPFDRVIEYYSEHYPGGPLTTVYVIHNGLSDADLTHCPTTYRLREKYYEEIVYKNTNLSSGLLKYTYYTCPVYLLQNEERKMSLKGFFGMNDKISQEYENRIRQLEQDGERCWRLAKDYEMKAMEQRARLCFFLDKVLDKFKEGFPSLGEPSAEIKKMIIDYQNDLYAQ